MDRSLDVITFEPVSNDAQPSYELPQTDTLQPPYEVAATSQQSAPLPWKPTEAQFCRVIAEHFEVTKKTVQQWFSKVVEAHPWIPQTQLRLADERYSPRCIELMGEYQAAVKRGLKFDSWKLEVQEQHSEDHRAYLASQQPQAQPHLPVAGEDQSEMMVYQPQLGELERFTPPERKIFKFTSTSAFVDKAKSQTVQSLDTVQANSSALMDSLINQMQSEGQKLGVELFRAKYGTAQSVLTELEQAMAKKSGLVEETAQSPKSQAG